MRRRDLVLPLVLILAACDVEPRPSDETHDASTASFADATDVDATDVDAPPPPPPMEHITHVPVAADAAVIYSSLGVGPAANQNFGDATTVDIGEYQLQSEGLFAYALAAAGVPAGATVSKAELVIPRVYAPGAPVVTLRLNRIAAASAWSEATVTWNTRPSHELLGEVMVTSALENRLDVTGPVAAAVAASAAEIGFALQTSPAATIDNVFIDAKEKSDGQPTWLEVHWSN